MTARNHSDIVALTEALYRADLARMQGLLVQEARLRADLGALEVRRHSDQDMAKDHLVGYRAAGADLLWQRWVGQSKARLNADLARLLGRKGQVASEMRRSFGKYQAATQIAAEEARRVTQRRDAAQMVQLEGLARLRRLQAL